MKFIYYVYAYLRDNGTPYYIGKGSGNRAWNKGSNDCIRPPKDRSRVLLVEQQLSEVGALALERFLIRWYGRKDIGTGILRNKSDGGDGSIGAPRTAAHRAAISNALKGRDQWWRRRQVVAPTGVVFPSIAAAAAAYNLTTEGMRYRCNVQKDGWHYL